MNAASPRLLIVVADGVRPDVLAEEMDAGRAPAMARLREAGGLHSITSSFPSVTGPAYVPFVMGRNPAEVGIPGLRWFDRSRSLRLATGSARSYAGIDIWHADHDVSRDAPTLLELATPSLAGMVMLARGATFGNVGRGMLWSVRAAIPHFRGDTRGWRTVERAATAAFLSRFGRKRPRLSMLAITSPDKFAHAYGNRSDEVRTSIGDVDAAIAGAHARAKDGGWFEGLSTWVVGDHGHAAVGQHDDIHGWLEAESYRVLAHPRLQVRNADIALMVGGNAMAHLYLTPAARVREIWPVHAPRFGRLHDALLARESVDLVCVSTSATTVRVAHATRGSAEIHSSSRGGVARWDYVAIDGDPLQLGGSLRDLDTCAAWTAASSTPYPDSIVQLSSLMSSARSGDIVLSAAEGWDLRSRWEPVSHLSTHGALLREQMLVPLLLDRPPVRAPMRTTDVVPSALTALGIEAGVRFDGRSFY